MEQMQDKLLLVDGNSIMNRAFFGIRELTTAEGIHTNAVFGFINILLRTLEEEKVTHIAVAFDLKAPTFRHLKYEAYKGNRKAMPDELREQMPLIKELLGQMNIKICEIEGFEADDIIGTLASEGEKKGFEVTVLSGDRDMLQLASKAIKISIPKTKGGATVTEHYYDKDVALLYGVSPKEFIDIKGLMGDPSDNIPGVPGIGEKTAIKLIETYHSIENIYEHLEELTGRTQSTLKENKDMAFLSKDLATICLDCDTHMDLQDCKITDIFTNDAYLTFKRLEFKSLLDRFQTSPKTTTTVVYEPWQVIKDASDFKNVEGSSEIAYLFIADQEDLLLSYTLDGNKVYYTDTTQLERSHIIDFVKGIIENTKVKKTTYDFKEQLHALDLDVNLDNVSIYDLSLGAYLLNPIKDSYHLDDIANDYLQMALPSLEEVLGKGKSRGKFIKLPLETLESFFVSATIMLQKAQTIMFQRLESEDMLALYFEIELPLLYVLRNMERLGVLVDAKQLKAYGNGLKEKITDLEQTIYAQAGEVFNINSPKQLGTILFDKLNLPNEKKNSTAADVLEKLKHKHPIIMEILTYRQLSKLKSTYADGLFDYIRSDGRIHTNFNQKVTSTGRISSTEPNLQNIPIRMEIGREIRKVFIPKEDHLFIDADYSQIELRLLAHLSKDESFVAAFKNNLDIHTMTASQVFHVPYEEVTSTQRRNAKAVNFGIVYGISAFGLSEDLNISRKEASTYIEQYFAKYPNVKTFLDESVREAKLTGAVKTMYGRKRQIPELNSSNFIQRSFGERVAMNTPIQGSAADIIKIAMIKVYRALQENQLKSRLILTVHDELVIEAVKDEVEQVQKILQDEMESAAQLLVPLTVDVHVGSNWFEAK